MTLYTYYFFKYIEADFFNAFITGRSVIIIVGI